MKIKNDEDKKYTPVFFRKKYLLPIEKKYTLYVIQMV